MRSFATKISILLLVRDAGASDFFVQKFTKNLLEPRYDGDAADHSYRTLDNHIGVVIRYFDHLLTKLLFLVGMRSHNQQFLCSAIYDLLFFKDF